MPFLFLLAFLCLITPALAEGFRCAGSQGIPTTEATFPPGIAAKPAQATPSRTTGTRRALVLFARFKGDPASPVPSWAADIFNSDLPGSFSHFYDTMSFGKLEVRGEVGPRVYESAQPASAYLENDQTPEEDFGRFSLEILRQADQDLDFAQFDNDGADGVPNSGDDDGAVDAVFLVLERIPAGFLTAEATGIARLGMDGVYISGDAGTTGGGVRVRPRQGTIQRGRDFAEAVGSVCHEYGHLLGLPDLYNVDYIAGLLGAQEGGPEEDSAGVGAWCLMGWGATGWNGNDGPNSFCAWSRMKLGWSPVRTLTEDRQTLALTDVGQGGAIYQISLNDREAFLLEYRRAGDNFYDRHLPAEGLLIWRINQRPLIESANAPHLVDLECADGRWRDAGYPQGKEPDPQKGGNNLDFWAHDEAYTRQHGGNLGDATDPFDGVRFTSFTPETNPSSYSSDGSTSIRLDDLRIEAGTAHLQVQTAPPRLTVESFRILDANKDQVLGLGEQAELRFWIANRGGLNAGGVRAVLRTDDPLVEILHAEASFGDLDVGKISFGQTADGLGFPRFRLTGDFTGTHTAALRLDIYTGNKLMASHSFAVTVGTARQTVQQVAVMDSSGNGDGHAQAGEIIQLSLMLADQHESIVPILGFSVHALDGRVQPISSPAVIFRMAEDGQARSAQNPEFLLSANLEAGTQLPFELAVDGLLGTWRDTVFVAVSAGGDQTPPRVNLLRIRAEPDRVEILLADRWIIDASPIRSARAVFYTADGRSQIAQIPLERQSGQFVGWWAKPPVGTYLMAGEIEDALGNRGQSRLLPVVVVPAGGLGSEGPTANHAWEPLGLPTVKSIAVTKQIAMSQSSPEVVYAADRASLWRSDNGGQTWQKTGLMFDGLFNLASIFVDPQDPLTVYMADSWQVLKSSDGGQHWHSVRMPDQGADVYMLGVDAVLPGRIYGTRYRPSSLLISEDEGQSWREVVLPETPAVVFTHPTAPQNIYLGNQYISSYSTKPGILWHSSDGGYAWKEERLDKTLLGISPDPLHPDGLYGAGTDAIWYSPDRGHSWNRIGPATSAPISGVQVHPGSPELVYAWGRSRLWNSHDKGQTWKGVDLPGSISQLVLHPTDPGRGFLLLTKENNRSSFQFRDFGERLEPLEITQDDNLAGAMAFTPAGQPFISTVKDEIPGVFTSVDGGRAWEWYPAVSSELPTFFEILRVDPVRPEMMIAHLALGLDQYVRSVDGGRTWRRLNATGAFGSTMGGSIRRYPRLINDAQHPGIYYLSSPVTGAIWRSIDFGENWAKYRKFPADPASGISFIYEALFDPLSIESLYAAQGDLLIFSADSASDWAEIGPVRLGETILTLEFHPEDPVSMYAVTIGGLYLSVDRAQTWEPLLQPEGARWASAQLRFDPRDLNHIFLVTSRFLYESNDAGQTWVDIGQGLGGFPWFNDLVFDPFDASTVYVATTWGVYKLDRTQRTTAVSETPATPRTFTLDPNYPNPFNPTTTIRFSLPQRGEAELSIYSLLGQRVATIVHGVQEAGNYVLQWNGRDEQGRELASGVYFYRLQAGPFHQTRRLVLVK